MAQVPSLKVELRSVPKLSIIIGIKLLSKSLMESGMIINQIFINHTSRLCSPKFMEWLLGKNKQTHHTCYKSQCDSPQMWHFDGTAAVTRLYIKHHNHSYAKVFCSLLNIFMNIILALE